MSKQRSSLYSLSLTFWGVVKLVPIHLSTFKPRKAPWAFRLRSWDPCPCYSSLVLHHFPLRRISLNPAASHRNTCGAAAQHGLHYPSLQGSGCSKSTLHPPYYPVQDWNLWTLGGLWGMNIWILTLLFPLGPSPFVFLFRLFSPSGLDDGLTSSFSPWSVLDCQLLQVCMHTHPHACAHTRQGKYIHKKRREGKTLLFPP